MDDCIFCKLVAGEILSYKIYETENFLAFLDIFPMTEGYTLVIPKKHYRWVWDVENIGEYFEVCQKIAKHYQEVTGRDGIYSIILGEEVPHAHVRIIPDKQGVFLGKISEFVDGFKSDGRIQKLEPDKAKTVLEKYKLS